MDFEQRINIKFCFKLQKSAKEAHEMLKSVYGDNVVTLKTVYKWYDRFKNGNECVKDEQRAGRPVTSRTDVNVQKVETMVHSNRRRTIRELSEDLNISYGSVQSILTDELHMRRDKHGIEIKKSNLCDICGKVLRDSQQLKLHKRAVHLNIKPFVGGICNKSFPKKYTLKNHEQTHKGKPFLCILCEKLFAKDITLQKHKQRCHTESKYKCDNCEKSFTSKLKLTTHLKNCNLTDE